MTGDEPIERHLPRRDALLLLGVLLLALTVRLSTFPALTREVQRLASVDCYGHLRRAAATVREFPSVPVFDPYLNHPDGGIWIWPPLFDLILATPAWLRYGSEASLEEIARSAAWLPPFLGVLALLPLFALARRTFDTGRAWLAILLYAALPAAIARATFGHTDQHVGEALCLLWVLAAVVGFLRTPAGSPRARWQAIGTGVALAAAVLTWQGAVFLAPLAALAAGWAGRSRGASLILMLAAILVAAPAFFSPGPTTYVSFGPFQPLFLTLVAALLLIASLGSRGQLAAGIGGLVSVLAWAPLRDGLLHLLSQTQGGTMAQGGYLAYPREWLLLIGEYRSLFADGLAAPLRQLSGGLLLFPAALGLWLWRARRADDRSAPWVCLCLFATAVAIMTLFQKRYVYYLAPFTVLAVADCTVMVARHWNRIAAGVLLLLAVLPTLPALPEIARAPGAPGFDLLLTLSRLADLDPPEGDPTRPALTEAGSIEGVMAPWAVGHFVTLFARRPAAADNFGYGFLRQSDIYSLPPERDQQLARLLAEAHCRYLVTTDLRSVIAAYAASAGRGEIASDQTLAVRLHESPETRPLPGLQLVLASQSAWPGADGRWIPRWKVFRVELPPGAAGSSTAGWRGEAAWTWRRQPSARMEAATIQ